MTYSKDAILEAVGVEVFARLLEEFGAEKVDRRMGRAKCPLHGGQSTGSLHYNPKGRSVVYDCFGCGEGGDVFTLTMKARNCTFPEAAEWLGSSLGLPHEPPSAKGPAAAPRPAPKPSGFAAPPDALRAARMARIWGALATKDEEGEAYLLGRGIRPDPSRVRFNVGKTGDAETDALSAKGYRIAVPLRHPKTGALVSFQSRRMDNPPPGGPPAKMNLAGALEGAVFGLPDGFASIGETDSLLAVEGLTDYLSAAAAGEIGTADGKNRVRLIGFPGAGNAKKLPSTFAEIIPGRSVFLALDRDEAGQRNAKETAVLLLEAKARPYLVRTVGKDLSIDLAAAQERGDAPLSALVSLLNEAAEAGVFDPREPVRLPAEGYAEEFSRELAHRETATAIPTGLASFDRKLGGGLLDGELYVLGGAPKSGKTALALRLAHAALVSGRPVVYASFEVPRFEILSRLIGANVGIPYRDLLVPRQFSPKHREDAQDEAARFFAAEGRFLQVIEPADLNLGAAKPGDAIQAALGDSAKRLADRSGKSPVIVFDFLQRIAAGGEDTETRVRVSDASYGLRNLAAADGFAVLALSSINRASYLDAHGAGKASPLVPPLGCLKESGDIEYSASGVFILWPSKDEIEARKDAGEDEAAAAVENVHHAPNLWIQYARHAPAGTAVLLSFRADLGTFAEREVVKPGPRPKENGGKRKPFSADALASIVTAHGKAGDAGTWEIETERLSKIAAADFRETSRAAIGGIVAKFQTRFREEIRGKVRFLILVPTEDSK